MSWSVLAYTRVFLILRLSHIFCAFRSVRFLTKLTLFRRLYFGAPVCGSVSIRGSVDFSSAVQTLPESRVFSFPFIFLFLSLYFSFISLLASGMILCCSSVSRQRAQRRRMITYAFPDANSQTHIYLFGFFFFSFVNSPG